jgi:hypothetical protein
MKRKDTKKLQKKYSIEELYLRMFGTNNIADNFKDNTTLEQPHQLRYVDSVTTYGAYQKPI